MTGGGVLCLFCPHHQTSTSTSSTAVSEVFEHMLSSHGVDFLTSLRQKYRLDEDDGFRKMVNWLRHTLSKYPPKKEFDLDVHHEDEDVAVVGLKTILRPGSNDGGLMTSPPWKNGKWLSTVVQEDEEGLLKYPIGTLAPQIQPSSGTTATTSNKNTKEQLVYIQTLVEGGDSLQRKLLEFEGPPEFAETIAQLLECHRMIKATLKQLLGTEDELKSRPRPRSVIEDRKVEKSGPVTEESGSNEQFETSVFVAPTFQSSSSVVVAVTTMGSGEHGTPGGEVPVPVVLPPSPVTKELAIIQTDTMDKAPKEGADVTVVTTPISSTKLPQRRSTRVKVTPPSKQTEVSLKEEEDELEEEIEEPLSILPDFSDGEDDDDDINEGELIKLSVTSNVCPTCDVVFPSHPTLESHIRQNHPDLVAEFTRRKFSPPKKKQQHQHTPAPSRSEVLKCHKCQRIFNHRNSMVYHMRSHAGERNFKCEQCGKCFLASSALKVHKRLHSGEKPYKCEHCERTFRQWGDLKYHVISIHSDIRDHQCEFCGKDFARKYSLIVHRRIHTGEKAYHCEFCEKSFRAASYLQNHRRIHTGEKPHSCSICAKPFRVRSDMKRHMASHNRDNGNSGQSQPQAASISEVRITQQQGHTGNVQVVQVQTHQSSSTTTAIVPTVTSGSVTTTAGSSVHLASAAATPTTVYQKREGEIEAVTFVDSNSGTVYVWPVHLVQ